MSNQFESILTIKKKIPSQKKFYKYHLLIHLINKSNTKKWRKEEITRKKIKRARVLWSAVWYNFSTSTDYETEEKHTEKY